MNHTVIVAYDQFSDVSVEQGVLDEVDGRIERIENLAAPGLTPLLSEAAALMVTVQQVTDEVLARMDHCKIVSRVGTGIDAIDVEAATARGIWVTNVPDYAVDEVATHTLSLLLALARRLPAWTESTRNGRWNDDIGRPIYRLSGQILGLVGFGRIGRATAKKAIAIGLNVIVFDPHLSSSEIQEHGVVPVSWEEIWRSSDYVSLHTPLNEKTQGMVDEVTLGMMKEGSFLINTARGGLINEQALLQAIERGQIAGAALDVMVQEPPPADHPLLQERRIIVTPHIGWYSEDSGHEVRTKAAEDVARVLRGQEPARPVNRP